MLQPKYHYLLSEPGPRVIVEGLKLMGLREIVGKLHSPIIMGMAKSLGIEKIYTNDELAWCGLSACWVLTRAGKFVPLKGWDILRARKYLLFGIPVKEAKLGDVLVYDRPGGHHVNFYVGEDAKTYHGMGGNQSNAWGITRIEKERCIGIRRPPYINTPPNVRPIWLSATGPISTDEA